MTEISIPLAIVEKNPLLGNELVAYLERQGPFRVVMRETEGEPIMEAAPSGTFDIAIIGWEMADGGGAKILDCLRRQSNVKVIVYTGCSRPDVPFRAMSHGAAGFCSKAEQPERLIDTILSVAAGKMVFPFLDVSQLSEDPLDELTTKEKHILATIARGETNRDIAQNFSVSINTVKFHIKNIYDKLGLLNRAQAAAYYLEKSAVH